MIFILFLLYTVDSFQLYRDNASLSRKIVKNVQGNFLLYAKSKTLQQSESKMLTENKIQEEEALKQQLQSLTEIGALIKVQQQVIIDALQTFKTKRELQRKEEAQRAATIEKQKHLAHSKQQQKEEQIRFRGTGWNANFTKLALKIF